MGLLDALGRVLHTLGMRGDITQFIVLFGLALARVGTAISMVPFLGGQSVPSKVKTGLAVVVVGLLYPALAAFTGEVPVNAVLVTGLLAKEVLVGATIGLLAQFVFYAVQTAGILVDTQRGMDQPSMLSAQLASHGSMLGNFKYQAALVLFLAFNGHLLFINAIYASYQKVPLVTFPHFKAGVSAVLEHIARLSADMLLIAVQIAAPVMVAMFLVDLTFGALQKVAGRINVHAESQPIKSLVGLALVFLVIGFVLQGMRAHFATMLRNLYDFLNSIT